MSIGASSDDRRPPGLHLPWPALSLGIAAVGVAALGTLVIIVTVQGVDLLSTVALALAILAFIAQLVGSWAQADAAAKSTADSHRVNAETIGLLGQIRAQSESMIANQKDQFGDVLRALIDRGGVREAVRESTVPETDEGDSSTTEGGTLDVDRIASTLERQLIALAGTPEFGASARGASPTHRHRDFVERMESFPAEPEGRLAFAALTALTPFEAALLAKRAMGDLARAQRGLRPGGALTDASNKAPATRALEAAGLIEFHTMRRRGEEVLWRRLTPLGIDAGRLLTARGAQPAWLKELQTGA